MKSFEESEIFFELPDDTVQYDDTDFYKDYVEKLKMTKAIDFLTLYTARAGKTMLFLTEVKNFEKAGKEVKERTNPNGGDPIHVETALKVRDTLAALVGVGTFEGRQFVEELLPYFRFLKETQDLKNTLKVVAFIEGSIRGYGKGHKDEYVGLRRKIEGVLKWLNCEVFVLDVDLVDKVDFGWIKARKQYSY